MQEKQLHSIIDSNFKDPTFDIGPVDLKKQTRGEGSRAKEVHGERSQSPRLHRQDQVTEL